MENPYSKKCPNCSKDFQARRLNQDYCTYFCKVRFNNERARLRRLELLEIEKKHQATQVVFSPKEIEKQESHIQEKPVSETKELPIFNWKNNIKIGVGILAIGAFIYSIYWYLTKNRQEIIPPNLMVQNELGISVNQIEENEKLQNVSPIPIDIYPKSVVESSPQFNHPPEYFG